VPLADFPPRYFDEQVGTPSSVDWVASASGREHSTARLLAGLDETELLEFIPDRIIWPEFGSACLEVAKRVELGGAQV
jgi:hypothetical protein